MKRLITNFKPFGDGDQSADDYLELTRWLKDNNVSYEFIWDDWRFLPIAVEVDDEIATALKLKFGEIFW